MEKLRRKFLIECEANLQLIRRGIEAAGTEAGRATALQDLFRGAHSIKGGSGFFGLERMGCLAAALETVCSDLISGALAFTGDIAAELTNATNFLADLAEAAGNGIELVEGYEQSVTNRLKALVRHN